MPVFNGKFIQRPAQLHAGVVDQYLNRAYRRLDVFDGCLHRSGLRHIKINSMHRKAFSTQQIGRLSELCTVAAIEHHCRAGFAQCACQCKTNTC